MMPRTLVACLLTCAALSTARATERPSIVFILMDDVGWRDLGCYGSDLHQTPHLDRLARDGLRFTSSYAAAHVCSPTRASILTGQYPARLHLTDYIPGEDLGRLRPPDWRRQLPPGTPTLATLLGDAGYATGFFGKWHLNRDKHYAPGRAGDPGSHGFETVLTTVRPGEDAAAGDDTHHARQITAAASAFIAAHRDQPFLCFVSHHLVHRPLLATDPAPLPDPPPTLHRDPVYAAMLADLDDSVGELLDTLAARGLAERTLVIVTSDNGGYPGREGRATSNDPLRGGKGTAYEGGVRVPTIIRWPGQVTPAGVSDTPIISNDFLPTLCAAAGVGLPARLRHDGRDLTGLLRNPQAGLPRQALYWHYPHYHALGARPHSVIRFEDWRLIEWLDDGGLELYDLATDPGEQTNLADEHPGIAAILRAQLAGWRRSVDAQHPRGRQSWWPFVTVAAVATFTIWRIRRRKGPARG